MESSLNYDRSFCLPFCLNQRCQVGFCEGNHISDPIKSCDDGCDLPSGQLETQRLVYFLDWLPCDVRCLYEDFSVTPGSMTGEASFRGHERVSHAGRYRIVPSANLDSFVSQYQRATSTIPSIFSQSYDEIAFLASLGTFSRYWQNFVSTDNPLDACHATYLPTRDWRDTCQILLEPWLLYSGIL